MIKRFQSFIFRRWIAKIVVLLKGKGLPAMFYTPSVLIEPVLHSLVSILVAFTPLVEMHSHERPNKEYSYDQEKLGEM